jgi:hypothetical protein
MSLSLTDLMRESLTDPRAATRRITGLGLPSAILWQALAAAVILTVLLEQALFWAGSGGGFPDPATLDPLDAQMLEMTRLYAENPVVMAMIQGGFAVLAIFAIHFVGRACGGQGAFEDALAMIAWFQIILLALQLAQALVGLVLPPLSGFIALATLVLFFYLLTMFTAEIHGFQSPGVVFAMIIATIIALAFAMTVILALFGVTFLPEMPNA